MEFYFRLNWFRYFHLLRDQCELERVQRRENAIKILKNNETKFAAIEPAFDKACSIRFSFGTWASFIEFVYISATDDIVFVEYSNGITRLNLRVIELNHLMCHFFYLTAISSSQNPISMNDSASAALNIAV